MDYDHYKFWYTAEWIINAGDNPFLSPAPIHSNIDGAMGVWVLRIEDRYSLFEVCGIDER